MQISDKENIRRLLNELYYADLRELAEKLNDKDSMKLRSNTKIRESIINNNDLQKILDLVKPDQKKELKRIPYLRLIPIISIILTLIIFYITRYTPNPHISKFSNFEELIHIFKKVGLNFNEEEYTIHLNRFKEQDTSFDDLAIPLGNIQNNGVMGFAIWEEFDNLELALFYSEELYYEGISVFVGYTEEYHENLKKEDISKYYVWSPSESVFFDRCKSCDVAKIFESRIRPEVNGRMVTVMQVTKDGPQIDIENGNDFQIFITEGEFKYIKDIKGLRIMKLISEVRTGEYIFNKEAMFSKTWANIMRVKIFHGDPPNMDDKYFSKNSYIPNNFRRIHVIDSLENIEKSKPRFIKYRHGRGLAFPNTVQGRQDMEAFNILQDSIETFVNKYYRFKER